MTSSNQQPIPAARPVARRGAAADDAAALPAADGVVAAPDGDVAGLVQTFIAALAQHRHFGREAALSASREGAPRAPQNAAPQNPARTPRRRSSR